MGIHYVNGELVDDADLNPRTPEAMVYRPVPEVSSGWALSRTRVPGLVGRAARRAAPRCSGRRSTSPSSNRFGLPAFYSLHVWVWKHNSAETFAMFNPDVHCRL